MSGERRRGGESSWWPAAASCGAAARRHLLAAAGADRGGQSSLCRPAALTDEAHAACDEDIGHPAGWACSRGGPGLGAKCGRATRSPCIWLWSSGSGTRRRPARSPLPLRLPHQLSKQAMLQAARLSMQATRAALCVQARAPAGHSGLSMAALPPPPLLLPPAAPAREPPLAWARRRRCCVRRPAAAEKRLLPLTPCGQRAAQRGRRGAAAASCRAPSKSRASRSPQSEWSRRGATPGSCSPCCRGQVDGREARDGLASRSAAHLIPGSPASLQTDPTQNSTERHADPSPHMHVGAVQQHQRAGLDLDRRKSGVLKAGRAGVKAHRAVGGAQEAAVHALVVRPRQRPQAAVVAGRVLQRLLAETRRRGASGRSGR